MNEMKKWPASSTFWLFSLVLCFNFFTNSSLFAQKVKDVSKVYSLKGVEVDLPTLWSNKPVIFFFYSVDCPLCRNYTKSVNDLSKQYQGKANLYMVFSGKHQKKGDINKYINKYKIEAGILTDPKYRLSEAVNANITPEAVLIKDGEIIYSGAIDDWVIRLGSTKTNVKEHYLEDALKKTLEGRKVSVKHVNAIGCYIK